MAHVDLLAAAAAPAGRYLHWGVLSISLTNALVVGAMLLAFVLALVLPFPHGDRDRRRGRGRS